jgi:hypothetical protein
MSHYKFKNIQHCWPSNIASEAFVWIWNPDRIPPHIGFSYGKNYLSLTYKESERKLTSSMIRKAKRSQIPLILVRYPAHYLEKEPTVVFSIFDRAQLGGATCLTPIKSLNKATENTQQLADFLTVLERLNPELEVFALHLEGSYTELPHYTVAQIMDRINELNGTKK